MTNPNKEEKWEKEFDEKFMIKDTISGGVVTDIKSFIRNLLSTQYHQDLMSDLVEKERSRLENEFGDFAHEHYRGCVREEDDTYTYGYDNEVIWLVREFFEKQAFTEAQAIIKLSK